MIIEKSIQRLILSNSKEFKTFWRENGPFQYVLTSMDFPPVLLEPEEWIFSSDITALLKDLMQFDKRKMRIVKSAFNPENKNILRPDKLIAWKINNFPEEWKALACDIFMPEGHLTQAVMDSVMENKQKMDANSIETSFFQCLAKSIEQIGYLLFQPNRDSKYADIKEYLSEWEKDDKEAGL